MVITIGNNKGGVGKTTLSTVFTYILSDLRKEKVLVIDTDQQSNLSKLLEITYEKKFDEKVKEIFSKNKLDFDEKYMLIYKENERKPEVKAYDLSWQCRNHNR